MEKLPNLIFLPCGLKGSFKIKKYKLMNVKTIISKLKISWKCLNFVYHPYYIPSYNEQFELLHYILYAPCDTRTND